MKDRIKVFLVVALLGSAAANSTAQSRLLPYITGFDTEEERAGWQQYRENHVHEDYTWKYSILSSGDHRLYHGWDFPQGWKDTIVDWFVSPPLQIIDSTTISLKLRIEGMVDPDEFLQLWFSDGNPNPLTGSFVKIATLDRDVKYEWLDLTLNIPYTSETGYIAFRYSTFGHNWYNVLIDDIVITSPCVGVREVRKDIFSIITIFPNPTNSQLRITSNELQENTAYTVYSVVGQVVIQGILSLCRDEINCVSTINVESLPAGIYYLKIANQTIKFIKL